MAEGYKRLTIDLAPDLMDDLRARAETKGISVTEWLRRAVALQVYVEDHKEAEGG